MLRLAGFDRYPQSGQVGNLLRTIRLARNEIQAQLRIRQAEQEVAFCNHGTIIDRYILHATGVENIQHDRVQRLRSGTYHDIVMEQVLLDGRDPDVALGNLQPVRYQGKGDCERD